MTLLVTGGSSFTGYWFVRALAEAGHRVVAPLRRKRSDYTQGVRATRVRELEAYAEIIEDCPFGSDAFLELCRAQPYALLCHHAAQVHDYKSPDFEIIPAIEANTHRLRDVLGILASHGTRAMLLTGTVFEAGEGIGSEPLRAVSPYGVSKEATASIAAFRCHEAGMAFHKFVIANPIGPLQEPRFCEYLMTQWKADQPAQVSTPDYVRDNIHVDLLAKAYATYVDAILHGTAAPKLNPSGYVETQGAFSERFAHEIRQRSGLACVLELLEQTHFPEPSVRVNSDPAAAYVSNWDEGAAWDAMWAYWRTATQ